MARCPDHAKDLVTKPGGRPTCPLCQGVWLTDDQAQRYTARLTVETRELPMLQARPRTCPDCETRLVPWRIGTMEAWVDRCPQCAGAWFDASDLRSLTAHEQAEQRRKAWASLPDDERKEFATELAKADQAPRVVENLSGSEMVLSAFGFPLVARVQGERFPLVTPLLCALFAAIWFAGVLQPEDYAFEALAWQPRQGLDWHLLTALAVHGGLLHLLGNLAVLWVYGGCVERKVPSWLSLVLFVALGVVASLVQGQFSPSALIGGASGAIAAFMGMAIPLQPQAQLKVVLWQAQAIRVPLAFGLVAQAGFQLLMARLGVPGIGWYAHLTGLTLGIVVGFIARRLA